MRIKDICIYISHNTKGRKGVYPHLTLQTRWLISFKQYAIWYHRACALQHYTSSCNLHSTMPYVHRMGVVYHTNFISYLTHRDISICIYIYKTIYTTTLLSIAHAKVFNLWYSSSRWVREFNIKKFSPTTVVFFLYDMKRGRRCPHWMNKAMYGIERLWLPCYDWGTV